LGIGEKWREMEEKEENGNKLIHPIQLYYCPIAFKNLEKLEETSSSPNQSSI
jgi:hypothetical protein